MNIQPNPDAQRPLSLATVLVTGGTGFVGAYVIRDLVLAGYRVKAIRRKPVLPSFISKDIFDKVEWFEGDVLDVPALESAMEQTDAVIHSAAIVSFDQREKQNLYQVNIEGTANVINAAIEKNIRRLIYVSSVAAIGKKKDGSLVDENTKWVETVSNTAYANSKYSGEMEVWRGIAEGLNGVIVNPSTILGYGDWNTSSSALFKTVYDGFPWYTNGMTGFVDVEDVSRAIVQLLATNIHSERFILNGENLTYRQVLESIANGFGKRRPSREATPALAAIAWRFDSLRSLVSGNKRRITRESARVAQGSTRFDNRKLLAALPGFTFTNIDETIKKACVQYAAKNHPS